MVLVLIRWIYRKGVHLGERIYAMAGQITLCYVLLGELAWTVLFQVIFAVIIVTGVLGNIVSFVIWLHGETSKKSSCAVYFMFLSITDLLILLIPGVLTYVAESLHTVLANSYLVICAGYLTSGYLLQQVSSWLTVAVTFQRTLCVFAPFTFARLYGDSSRAAYISASVIVTVALLLNVTHTFAYKIESYRDLSMCTFVNETFRKLMAHLRLVSYTFMSSLIPLVLTVTCNFILLIKLSRSRFQNQASRDRSRNITKLVLAIGIVYTISTLPWAVHTMAEMKWIELKFPGSYILFCLSMSPVYYNNAINPWIYCVFGAGFRNDLQLLLRKAKCRICFKHGSNSPGSAQTINTVA